MGILVRSYSAPVVPDAQPAGSADDAGGRRRHPANGAARQPARVNSPTMAVRASRGGLFPAATLCPPSLLLSAPLLLSAADSTGKPQTAPQTASQTGTAAPATAIATADEVKARCGICHPAPAPDVLPKSRWRDELLRMMLIQEGMPEPADGVSYIPLPPEL